MEINVGDYVRTKSNGIKQIYEIDNKKSKYKYLFKLKKQDGDDCVDLGQLCNDNIIKHSKDIIDLIEVGDYVNGYYVYYCYCADEDSTGLFIDTEKGRQWLDKPSQVKSIVTKEQFEANAYTIEKER